jgi:hypothetical protein
MLSRGSAVMYGNSDTELRLLRRQQEGDGAFRL